MMPVTVFAQVGDYEGRPVSTVEVVLEGSPPDPDDQAEFQSLLKIVSGKEYAAVNARQSLQDLFASGRVAAARIEIAEVQPGGRGLGHGLRALVLLPAAWRSVGHGPPTGAAENSAHTKGDGGVTHGYAK